MDTRADTLIQRINSLMQYEQQKKYKVFLCVEKRLANSIMKYGISYIIEIMSKNNKPYKIVSFGPQSQFFTFYGASRAAGQIQDHYKDNGIEAIVTQETAAA